MLCNLTCPQAFAGKLLHQDITTAVPSPIPGFFSLPCASRFLFHGLAAVGEAVRSMRGCASACCMSGGLWRSTITASGACSHPHETTNSGCLVTQGTLSMIQSTTVRASGSVRTDASAPLQARRGPSTCAFPSVVGHT